MTHSESIAKIASAIVKAQGELNTVAKDATNPHYRSRYATLHGIVESTRETLRKHGLAVVQTFGQTDGTYIDLTTTLLHESGEWMSGILTVRPAKPDAQGIGSAATYARRYSLSAIIGIVTDDDDDGNIASAQQVDRGLQGKSESVDDKAWLNAVDKKGNLTEKGYEVVKFLSDNEGKTLADIRKKYKVSTTDAEAIGKALAEVINA